jgi:hypothetical protein
MAGSNKQTKHERNGAKGDKQLLAKSKSIREKRTVSVVH